MSNEIVRSFEAMPIPRDADFMNDLEAVSHVTYEAPIRLFGKPMENLIRENKSAGGIRDVHGFATIPGIIKSKTALEGVILKGVGEDYNWDFIKDYLEVGQVIDYPADKVSEAIIISRTTANRLEVGPGDKFIIHFVRGGKQKRKRFEVVGIYNTGLIEYDEKIAMIDLRHVQNLYGWEAHQIGGYELFVDNVDDIPQITEHIYYEALPNDLFAESIQERFPGIFQWLELQNQNERIIFILMIIVSIINLTTVLLILILERTNMIGVLKSFGMRNWTIQKIFLIYAGKIIVYGIVLGNVIGLALCWLQYKYHFIKLSEADYYLSHAPISINVPVLVFINVGLISVTLVFLLLPSFLVGRIDPVKAIRFK